MTNRVEPEGPAASQEDLASDLTTLPFDIYQRYRLLADLVLLGGRGAGGERLRVLDVGGFPGHLGRFLPSASVTFCDLLEGTIAGRTYVRGSAAALPFASASFDVVCCCDVLEHLPPESRRRALEELHRVAQRAMVVAGPFAEPGVAEAERLVADYYRSLRHEEHPWLVEHLRHGLPDPGEVLSWARERGLGAAVLPNGYLHHWILMMLANHLAQSMPGFLEMYQHFNKYYNLYFYPESNREPCYRRVIYLQKGAGDLPGPLPATLPARAEERGDIHDLFRMLIVFFRCLSDRAVAHEIHARGMAGELGEARALNVRLQAALAAAWPPADGGSGEEGAPRPAGDPRTGAAPGEAVSALPGGSLPAEEAGGAGWPGATAPSRGAGEEVPAAPTGLAAGAAQERDAGRGGPASRPPGGLAGRREQAFSALLAEQGRLLQEAVQRQAELRQALDDHRRGIAVARDQAAGLAARIDRLEEALAEARGEVERWRGLAEALGRNLEAVEGSRAFRVARTLGQARRRLLGLGGGRPPGKR